MKTFRNSYEGFPFSHFLWVRANRGRAHFPYPKQPHRNATGNVNKETPKTKKIADFLSIKTKMPLLLSNPLTSLSSLPPFSSPTLAFIATPCTHFFRFVLCLQFLLISAVSTVNFIISAFQHLLVEAYLDSLHPRLAVSSNTYHLLPKFNQFLDARAFYIISRKTGLFSVITTDSMWVLLKIPKYLIFSWI